MRIRTEYTPEEITAMIVEYHEAKFGKAPEGQNWKCDISLYGRVCIESVKPGKEEEV